jgi:spore germination protein YaaH
MHQSLPGSNVTVSVYASAAKFPKIYDIGAIAKATDGIFMMAYDFATSGSDNAMPTDPLYGYKEGKYWYDVSTAVEDFAKVMPKNKLILGLPWYGYDYPVSQPSVKAAKDDGYYSYYWYRGRKYRTFVARPQAHASTYALAKSNIAPDQEGWDEEAQVGWKAYKDSDGWRMIYLDDEKSLGIKYDFAKQQGLGGVGMWALGFDDGSTELWTLLEDKFGKKLVASRI